MFCHCFGSDTFTYSLYDIIGLCLATLQLSYNIEHNAGLCYLLRYSPLDLCTDRLVQPSAWTCWFLSEPFKAVATIATSTTINHHNSGDPAIQCLCLWNPGSACWEFKMINPTAINSLDFSHLCEFPLTQGSMTVLGKVVSLYLTLWYNWCI